MKDTFEKHRARLSDVEERRIWESIQREAQRSPARLRSALPRYVLAMGSAAVVVLVLALVTPIQRVGRLGVTRMVETRPSQIVDKGLQPQDARQPKAAQPAQSIAGAIAKDEPSGARKQGTLPSATAQAAKPPRANTRTTIGLSAPELLSKAPALKGPAPAEVSGASAPPEVRVFYKRYLESYPIHAGLEAQSGGLPGHGSAVHAPSAPAAVAPSEDARMFLRGGQRGGFLPVGCANHC